jgi:hypothetical protein
MGMEDFSLPTKKTPEQELQEQENVKEYRSNYLKSLGIELLSREEVAKMSFSEVMSYQSKMKSKILEAMNSLSEEDLKNKRLIFDEALSKINIVNNPNDLERLKSELGNK